MLTAKGQLNAVSEGGSSFCHPASEVCIQRNLCYDTSQHSLMKGLREEVEEDVYCEEQDQLSRGGVTHLSRLEEVYLLL